MWHVWTDGSCQTGIPQTAKGQRGWGGWAAIIEHGSEGTVLRGREPETTNVRMELRAALEGLRAVPEWACCVLHTDCTTLVVAHDYWLHDRVHTGRDGRLWRELAAEFDRIDVSIALVTRGRPAPIHRRAHVIAGAEARAGLRNLPANATPIVIDKRERRRGAGNLHSVKGVSPVADALRAAEEAQERKRQRAKHHPDCSPPSTCVLACEVWRELGHGPAVLRYPAP